MTISELNKIKKEIESESWIKDSSCSFNFGNSIGVSCDISENYGQVLPVVDLKNKALKGIGGNPISFYGSLAANNAKLDSLRFSSSQPASEHFPTIYSYDNTGTIDIGSIIPSIVIQGNEVMKCPEETYLDSTISSSEDSIGFRSVAEASLSYYFSYADVNLRRNNGSLPKLLDSVLSVALDKFYVQHGCSVFDYLLQGNQLFNGDTYSLAQLCSNFLTNLDGTKDSYLEINQREYANGVSYRVNQISSIMVGGSPGDEMSFDWNVPLYDIDFKLLSAEYNYQPALDLHLKFYFDRNSMTLFNKNSDPRWSAIAEAERQFSYDDGSGSLNFKTVTNLFSQIRVLISIPLIISSDYDYDRYETIIRSISIPDNPIENNACRFGWAIDDLRYSKILSSYWTQNMAYDGYEFPYFGSGFMFPSYYSAPDASNYARKIDSHGYFSNTASFTKEKTRCLLNNDSDRIACSRSISLSSNVLNAESVTLGDMNVVRNELHLSSNALTSAYQFIDSNVSAIEDGSQDTKQRIKSILGI